MQQEAIERQGSAQGNSRKGFRINKRTVSPLTRAEQDLILQNPRQQSPTPQQLVLTPGIATPPPLRTSNLRSQKRRTRTPTQPPTAASQNDMQTPEQTENKKMVCSFNTFFENPVISINQKSPEISLEQKPVTEQLELPSFRDALRQTFSQEMYTEFSNDTRSAIMGNQQASSKTQLAPVLQHTDNIKPISQSHSLSHGLAIETPKWQARHESHSNAMDIKYIKSLKQSINSDTYSFGYIERQNQQQQQQQQQTQKNWQLMQLGQLRNPYFHLDRTSSVAATTQQPSFQIMQEETQQLQQLKRMQQDMSQHVARQQHQPKRNGSPLLNRSLTPDKMRKTDQSFNLRKISYTQQVRPSLPPPAPLPPPPMIAKTRQYAEKRLHFKQHKNYSFNVGTRGSTQQRDTEEAPLEIYFTEGGNSYTVAAKQKNSYGEFIHYEPSGSDEADEHQLPFTVSQPLPPNKGLLPTGTSVDVSSRTLAAMVAPNVPQFGGLAKRNSSSPTQEANTSTPQPIFINNTVNNFFPRSDAQKLMYNFKGGVQNQQQQQQQQQLQQQPLLKNGLNNGPYQLSAQQAGKLTVQQRQYESNLRKRYNLHSFIKQQQQKSRREQLQQAQY